jgi:hypothetical protein
VIGVVIIAMTGVVIVMIAIIIVIGCSIITTLDRRAAKRL